ncbi:MAG: putative quinol monooxygenase [Desulfomonilaceae bacterium]
MITLVAIAQAKPGKEEVLKETLLALVPQTRQEAGCVNYDLHRSLSKPGVFMFHENWADREALQKHSKMPYMLDLRTKMADLLAEPLQFELYEMISSR